MKSIPTLAFPVALVLLAGAATLTGCDKKPDSQAAPAPTPAPAGTGSHTHGDDHGHADGSGHDHGDDHDHGPTTQLGEVIVDGYTIKASRDGGITAGGDAPIDVWITGGLSKATAVRFWIGTQDAKGSMKAKAELEKDNWHTHVEVPKPLPQGSKLWVEIDAEGREKVLAGFELKG